MSKSAVISARIDPDLKESAERIFQELGLTTTQAITLFYKQVDLQGGLPFEVRLPNETTKRAIKEAKERYNLTRFQDTKDLFEDLGIE